MAQLVRHAFELEAILPAAGLLPVTLFCATPLMVTSIASPAANTSMAFHSPSGFFAVGFLAVDLLRLARARWSAAR